MSTVMYSQTTTTSNTDLIASIPTQTGAVMNGLRASYTPAARRIAWIRDVSLGGILPYDDARLLQLGITVIAGSLESAVMQPRCRNP